MPCQRRGLDPVLEEISIDVAVDSWMMLVLLTKVGVELESRSRMSVRWVGIPDPLTLRSYGGVE